MSMLSPNTWKHRTQELYICALSMQRNFKWKIGIFQLTKSLYTTAGIYLLKFNNKSTRTMCEIYSKVTIKTPAQRRRFHTLFWCFCCCFEQVSDKVNTLFTFDIVAKCCGCFDGQKLNKCLATTKLSFTCSKSTIEILERGVKYV